MVAYYCLEMFVCLNCQFSSTSILVKYSIPPRRDSIRGCCLSFINTYATSNPVLISLPTSPSLRKLLEVRMLQSLSTNQSPIRIILKQIRQQIRRIITPQRFIRDKVRNRPLIPLWEFWIEMRQSIYSMPIRVGVGRSPPLKDFNKLINIRSTGE